ncbi:MAG: DNA primase DnaG [Acidilobaceae archaeon]
MIKARVEVDGKVGKHDIIGAVFGQTEGLLGSEFNLEDLQEKDRIGRVLVDVKYVGNKTTGILQVSSNLDRVETAILAAMLETVDRVGPYNARVIVEEVRDLRAEKIKYVIDRAKEILKKIREEEPDVKEIIRQIEEEMLKAPKIIEFGPEKLPAGPQVESADTLIVVEGRADVVNLLRYGYENVIALEGAREKVPESLKKLAENKKVVLFVDGDRGGELIIMNVLGQMKVDYIARAPKDKEVEKLTAKEVAKALSEMTPVDEFVKSLKQQAEAVSTAKPTVLPEVEVVAPEAKTETATAPVAEAIAEVAQMAETTAPTVQPELEVITLAIPKNILESASKLKGTLEAIVYDSSWNEVMRVKVKDLFNVLQGVEAGKVYAVILDGIITQRLVDVATEKNISLLIGARAGSKVIPKSPALRMLTFADLGI